MSSSGMMPPPVIRMSSRPDLDEQLADAGEERHVRAGEDRQADHVDVLLHGGGGDHLRRLVQPGVDHLHPGVAQRRGDDLGAAVVAVETRLGDQHADRARAASVQEPGIVSERPPFSRSSASAASEAKVRQSCDAAACSGGSNSTASIPAARAPTTSTSYRSPT